MLILPPAEVNAQVAGYSSHQEIPNCLSEVAVLNYISVERNSALSL